MKLYWSSRSPFARKVMVAAEELGVADQILRVPAVVAPFMDNPTPSEENPLGKLPVLVADDGESVFGSGAICLYLEGLEGGDRRLFPEDPAAARRVASLHALADDMLSLLVFRRMAELRFGGEDKDVAKAQVTARLNALADWLEPRVAPFDKDMPDIAAISLGVGLGYLDFRWPDFGWRDGHPALAGWYARVSSRPSFRNTEYSD